LEAFSMRLIGCQAFFVFRIQFDSSYRALLRLAALLSRQSPRCRVNLHAVALIQTLRDRRSILHLYKHPPIVECLHNIPCSCCLASASINCLFKLQEISNQSQGPIIHPSCPNGSP
jgi:hypothetical protein